jgi:hypothetical protein
VNQADDGAGIEAEGGSRPLRLMARLALSSGWLALLVTTSPQNSPSCRSRSTPPSASLALPATALPSKEEKKESLFLSNDIRQIYHSSIDSDALLSPEVISIGQGRITADAASAKFDVGSGCAGIRS